MLIKLGEEWMDVAMLEFVRASDPEDTRGGGETQYRGELGFIAFDAADGKPLMVAAKFVRAARADGRLTELEMVSGTKLLVEGTPEWCADLINRVRRHVA